MRWLIERVFLEGAGESAAAMDDGAAIPFGDRWLIVTTDSHVIQPITFPGGDIGRLAVSGTVNDLAMMGATEPLGLTCGIVLEEGFELEVLRALQRSMRESVRRGRHDHRHRRHEGDGTRRGGRRGRQHDRRRASPTVSSATAACSRATAFSSPARSATTAWPSCRCATSSNSNDGLQIRRRAVERA